MNEKSAHKTSRTQRVLQGTARWLAGGTAVVSPWLFGAAEPWSYLLLSLVVWTAVMFWLFATLASRRPEFRVAPVTLALAGLVAVVALQTARLPPTVVRLLSPNTADLVADSARTLAELAALDGRTDAQALPVALSLSPAATTGALWLLVAYAGIFLVVINCTRHWRHVTSLAAAVAVSGFFLALVGLAQKFSGSRDMLWIHTPRHGGNIFGPFTNKNHFAACMNLCFGTALGLLLSSQPIAELASWSNWRERLSWLSSRTASQLALTVFAVALMGGSMCATISRGGVLSLAGAMLLAGGVVWVRFPMNRRLRFSMAAVGLLVLAAMAWLARSELVTRLGTLGAVARNPMADDRWIATSDTLRLFARYAFAGTGFGAFRHAFTTVQTPDLRFRWLHAHNDWAQLLAEGGVLGTLAVVVLLAVLIRYVALRFRDLSPRGQFFVLGLAVGLTALALHSAVDYSLHKPANAMLMSLITALAVSAVHLRHVKRDQRLKAARRHELLRVMITRDLPVVAPPPRQLTGPWRRRVMRTAAVGGMLLATVAVVPQWKALRGELAFARFLYLKNAAMNSSADTRELVVDTACQEIDIVAQCARRHPDELGEITAALLQWAFDSDLPRAFRNDLAGKAVETASLAVTGAPSDYLAWLGLARTYFALGQWDQSELALGRARALVRHPEQVRMFEPPEAPATEAGAGRP